MKAPEFLRRRKLDLGDIPADPYRFLASEHSVPRGTKKPERKTTFEQTRMSPADLRRWAAGSYRAGIASGTDRMWDERDA